MGTRTLLESGMILPKVVGSNPTPATKIKTVPAGIGGEILVGKSARVYSLPSLVVYLKLDPSSLLLRVSLNTILLLDYHGQGF